MICPFCGAPKTKVIDTGEKNEGTVVQRRRECLDCRKRFNTFERSNLGMPMIVKADGARQLFSREKLTKGIQIACAKRPVSSARIESLVDEIERDLQNSTKREISSRMIGDKVIAGLKSIDPIAYIRYAIVYLKLDDLGAVRAEIDRLTAEGL